MLNYIIIEIIRSWWLSGINLQLSHLFCTLWVYCPEKNGFHILSPIYPLAGKWGLRHLQYFHFGVYNSIHDHSCTYARDWKLGRIDSFNMHTCGNAMHCWFVGKDACTSSGITLHHVHGTFMKFLPGLAGQVLLGQKAPCCAEPDVYLLLNISAQPWRQHGVVATATSGLTRHQGQMNKKMRRAIKHDKKMIKL